jgi:hypothetical protein
MKILLDTNILLLKPQILAKKKEGIVLAVPFPVRLELAVSSFTRTGVTQISQLVDEAVKAGNVQIEKLTTIPSLERTAGLSGTDIELITLAQELSARGEEVVVASQDRGLAAAAQALGIRRIGLSELEELLSGKATPDLTIERKATSILASQKRNLIGSFIAGSLSSLIASALWTYSSIIISKITVWGTSFCVVFLGVFAYALRGRFRLTYGVFEFVFGAIVAIRVFWPNFDYQGMQTADFLQVLAGVYVMVRGQDNIGKALQLTRFGPLWGRFSGER